MVAIVQSVAETGRWIVFSATLSLAALAGAPVYATSLNDELSAAAKVAYQGQVDPAIQALKPIADKQISSAPSLEGKLALEYLLDICVAGFDFKCLTEYWPKYSRLVASLTGVLIY